MTLQIINPETLGAPRGYAHGVLAPAGGRLLFVAGQCARDRTQRMAAADFVGQFAQALANVVTVVLAAGGKSDHLARLTIYVTDKHGYLSSLAAVGEAYRRVMGKHYPAMALVEVKALVDPQALVEIEGTAVLPPT